VGQTATPPRRRRSGYETHAIRRVIVGGGFAAAAAHMTGTNRRRIPPRVVANALNLFALAPSGSRCDRLILIVAVAFDGYSKRRRFRPSEMTRRRWARSIGAPQLR